MPNAPLRQTPAEKQVRQKLALRLDPGFRASLRLRLALWYVAFSLICMTLYGAALSFYLKHELRASRDETMLRRELRFVRFIDTDARDYPAHSLGQQIAHFSEASPESDVIEVLDPAGRRLYPVRDPGLPLRLLPPGDAAAKCAAPCLTAFDRDGHHWRLLTHRTMLGGRPLWLLMAGSVDEHYDILNSVRTGYFLLLPLILLGSVTGGYALSRTALIPVGRLTERARSISLASLDGRLPVPNTGDELQSLAEAWNDLLVRLETEVNRSTRLAMDVSHDLRSAMTVIFANAELSLRRSRTPEQYRNTLSAIQQESTHVLAMLEDMLLVAQTGEAGKKLDATAVCLDELVQEVYEASQAAADIKGQRLSLALPEPPAGGVWLKADRSLLRRLISILVDNALKYTPPGGQIALSLRRTGEGAVLSVSDTGIGIPADLQSRVFDRLFRADAARSRKDMPGSGLGLSIAKWITDLHGYTIELVSGVDEGSVFSVIFPLSAAEPGRLPAWKPSRRQEPVP